MAIWLTALSWAPKVLPFLKSVKGVASIVFLAAAVALYLYVGHLQNKVEDLTDSQTNLTRYLAEATEINQSMQDANGELAAANEALARSVEISEEERIRAVQDAADRELEARLALDNTLDELEDLRNETPSCAELSKIDMGAVCPAVVDRLREHAAGTIGRTGND